MKLTNDDVQQILQLLEATSFDVLEIETDRFKLTLRRHSPEGWTQEAQLKMRPAAVQTMLSSPADSLPENVSSPAEDLIDVRSSLPGTFYRASQPGAPPFVEVGSAVEPSTVVGIVETMKLMNAVHAGARGHVAEICFENAQFASQGATLMRIRPESV